MSCIIRIIRTLPCNWNWTVIIPVKSKISKINIDCYANFQAAMVCQGCRGNVGDPGCLRRKKNPLNTRTEIHGFSIVYFLFVQLKGTSSFPIPCFTNITMTIKNRNHMREQCWVDELRPKLQLDA